MPEMMARYFDDLEVGDSFTTKGRTITEADLVNFAALTWDTYPLHVDAEWASRVTARARRLDRWKALQLAVRYVSHRGLAAR